MEEIRCRPEYHKFLIGRGGTNIRKVRESTGARVIFPTAQDPDTELITVMGKEDSVKEARQQLEDLIKDLVRQMCASLLVVWMCVAVFYISVDLKLEARVLQL